MSLFSPPNIQKLKNKGDIRGLVKALGYQKDDHVQKAAADALVAIGESAFKPLFRYIVDQDHSEEFTHRLVEVIIRIDHPHTPGYFVGEIDRTKSIKNAKLKARNRILFEAVVSKGAPATRSAVRLPDEYRKEFFTRIGKQAVDELIKIVARGNAVCDVDSDANDVDPWEIAIAIPLLVEFAGENATDLIISSLNSTFDNINANIRLAAIKSLGKIGDERAVKPLMAVFSEYDLKKWREVDISSQASAALRSIVQRTSLSSKAYHTALAGIIPIPKITEADFSFGIDSRTIVDIPWEFSSPLQKHTFMIGMMGWNKNVALNFEDHEIGLAIARRCFNSLYDHVDLNIGHRNIARAKLGVLVLKDGNFTEAIDHFFNVMRDHHLFYESVYEVSFCLAELLQAMGRQSEAKIFRRLCDKAVEAAPQGISLQLPLSSKKIFGLVDDLQTGRNTIDAVERQIVFPKVWSEKLEYRQLLNSIRSSPFLFGKDCPYYQDGICMFNFISGEYDVKGPEKCSFIGGSYLACTTWQTNPGYLL